MLSLFEYDITDGETSIKYVSYILTWRGFCFYLFLAEIKNKIMKKLLLGAILLFSILSCTDNQRARKFGGTETITLPKNRILLNATWKESNLWILSKDTLTNQVFFNEKSSFGVLEGTIEFKNN